MDLNSACCKNNVDVFNKLVSENPDLLNHYDSDGFLPIHYAATEGSIDVLKLILAKNLIYWMPKINVAISHLYMFFWEFFH